MNNPKLFHVVAYDYETTCERCNEKPTRYYVLEMEKHLCEPCLMIVTAIEIIKQRTEEVKDLHRRVERHLVN